MSDFIVGLTGGIGSGKTAVSDRFAALGIAIVDADVASRAVVAPGMPALAAIAGHFGADMLTREGALDRARLRQRVFEDRAARRWLEQLTHPLIGVWLRDGLARATSSYAVLVNPLLVESGQAHRCDRVLVVDAPESVQITRTAARDSVSEASARAVMEAQTDRHTRLAQADDVIVNDRDLTHLDRSVAGLHARYLALAAAKAASAAAAATPATGASKHE